MSTNPVRYINNTNNYVQEPVIENSSTKLPIKLNISSDDININSASFGTAPETTKKAVAKKTVKTKPAPDGNGGFMVVGEEEDLPMYQSNQPYTDSYQETNNMLKTSVIQIDMLAAEVKKDLDDIRASKTLKGKYTYVSNIASTISALASTKITAIREMNKVINDCHNLELKRVKDLKLDQSEISDDKAVMDMYNAYISMPYGQHANIAPPMLDMTMGGSGLVRADIGSADFANYQANLNPTQAAWRHEQDPNIKTVVKYGSSTGARFFDVVNLLTGESIPGVPRPDPMFLEDTMIDQNNGIARNTNLDTTYKLLLINNPSLANY